AHHPSDSTAECEPANTHRGHVARGEAQAECVSLCIYFAPGQPGLDARYPSSGVDDQALHAREVDDYPTVDRAMTREAVTAAAYSPRQILLACEGQGSANIGRGGAAYNQGRPAID